MDTVLAAAVRTPYRGRPGRSVLVVNDLADLRGPVRNQIAEFRQRKR